MKTFGKTAASGFTLLEVMVALVVLAVGVAATMSVLSGSLGNIRKAQMRTRMIDYAHDIMESSFYREELEQPALYVEDLEDGFQYRIRVEDYDPGTEEDGTGSGLTIKLLAYTVEMIGPDSPEPAYTLETLKIVSTSEEGQSPTAR